MVGRTIDAYELIEQLGEGATATVWRVRHRMLQKDFALKLLRANVGSQGSRAQRRFLREAKALSLVRSDHVVGLSDFGVSPEREPYLVMEWIRGHPLSALIRGEGKLSRELTRHLSEQIASGLVAVHASGAIHRDIKPDNIMLVQPPDGALPVAKIVDLGLVCGDPSTFPALTRGDAVLGTPAYMAPEQIARDALDHRADIYAFGITMYEMLTGRLPFRAATLLDMLRAQIEQRAPTLEPDFEALGALVDRMLEKSATDRPESATLVREELVALAPTQVDREATAALTRIVMPRDDSSATRLTPTPLTQADEPAAVPASPTSRKPPGRPILMFVTVAIAVIATATVFLIREPKRSVEAVPVRPEERVVVTPRKVRVMPTVPTKTSPAKRKRRARAVPAVPTPPARPLSAEEPDPPVAEAPPPVTRKKLIERHRDIGRRLRNLAGRARVDALSALDRSWIELRPSIRNSRDEERAALANRLDEIEGRLAVLEHQANALKP